MTRDRRNDALLKEMDWVPVHFWEKEVKKDLAGCIESIEELIVHYRVERHMLRFPEGKKIDIQ